MSGYHGTGGSGGGGGGNVVLYDSLGVAISTGAPADAIVNANVNAVDVRAFLEMYNGATLERIRSANAVAGGTGTGLLGAGIMGFDGTNYNRPFASGMGNDTSADVNVLYAAARNSMFDGTQWIRSRSNAAAVLAGATQEFGQLVAGPGEWCEFHIPAPNVQATCTRAAGGAGVKLVVTRLRFSTVTVAGTTSLQTVELVEDVAGAATVIWSSRIAVLASNPGEVHLSGLNFIQPTANKTLTARFTAAGAANCSESVSMHGYSTK